MASPAPEQGHPADHPGPFVLVDDLEAPVLADADRHHLERVLRLRAGDLFVLGDGRGAWRPARLGAVVTVTGDLERAPRPRPAVAVGFALVKGDKPEVVVQKLTELGVDRIVPFRADRSVVRWDAERAAKAHTRLVAVARAATMQCHRPWLPAVAPVAELRDLLAEPGVAIADRAGAALADDHRVVLVGPEGGWTPEERAMAVEAGARCVAVNRHVLRAETAAIAVGVLLTGMRDGWVMAARTERRTPPLTRGD